MSNNELKIKKDLLEDYAKFFNKNPMKPFDKKNPDYGRIAKDILALQTFLFGIYEKGLIEGKKIKNIINLN